MNTKDMKTMQIFLGGGVELSMEQVKDLKDIVHWT